MTVNPRTQSAHSNRDIAAQRLRVRRHSISALIISGTILFSGCGGYGSVSPRTYELAKSLYSISSTKSMERLDSFDDLLEHLKDSGELPDREYDWLKSISQTARAGKWERASKQARRILQDQVAEN